MKVFPFLVAQIFLSPGRYPKAARPAVFPAVQILPLPSSHSFHDRAKNYRVTNHPQQFLLMLFVCKSFITMGPVPLEELGSNPNYCLFQEISAFPQKQLALPPTTTDCRTLRRQIPTVAAVTGSCPSYPSRTTRSAGEGLFSEVLDVALCGGCSQADTGCSHLGGSTSVAKVLCQVPSPVLGCR